MTWGPTAAQPTSEIRELEVVAPTPATGAGISLDKLPATVDVLSAEDFRRSGSLSVTETLGQRVAGASVSDTQGNGFTRELDFRGFEASPVQGAPRAWRSTWAACG